jgi:hypothetical protein
MWCTLEVTTYHARDGARKVTPESIDRPEDVRAGDIGFGPIPGKGGWAARLGMWALQDDTRYPHTFVVAGNSSGLGMDVVEAMQPSARYAILDPGDRWGPEYCYIRPDYTDDRQAWNVVHHAMMMVGLPYGWMNFPYLGMKRLGINGGPIDAYVSRKGGPGDGYPASPICSQLVDAALTLAGFHTFDDGRLSQDVTPGDMLYGLLALQPRAIAFPR